MTGSVGSMVSETAVDERNADQSGRGDSGPGGALLRRVLTGDAVTTLLAVVLALVVGAILVVVTNPAVQASAGYFAARPGDTFQAIGAAAGGTYAALFRGGIVDPSAATLRGALQPLLTSLSFAAPLLLAGLGVAMAFRSGLFNIGGQGQILIGGAAAGAVGFALPLPPALHVVGAVAAAVLGGAVWAGIAGALKARTGAHEVITTIMLNYVAFYLVDYLLRTPVLGTGGSAYPVSRPLLPTAFLSNIPGTTLNTGIFLAIIAVVVVWWLLERSSVGYRMRAVGLNPEAARFGGISIARTTVLAMLLSGALAGAAGGYQVLATSQAGFASNFDAGIGFTAITVALLGRSRPFGVAMATILFGVLSAGGYALQASQNVDVDIVYVLQSLIVLFIAAPPLIRAIFRLPSPGTAPRKESK